MSLHWLRRGKGRIARWTGKCSVQSSSLPSPCPLPSPPLLSSPQRIWGLKKAKCGGPLGTQMKSWNAQKPSALPKVTADGESIPDTGLEFTSAVERPGTKEPCHTCSFKGPRLHLFDYLKGSEILSVSNAIHAVHYSDWVADAKGLWVKSGTGIWPSSPVK